MKKTIFKFFPTLVVAYENVLTSEECLDLFTYCLQQQNILSGHRVLKGEASSTHYSMDCIDFLDKLEKNVSSAGNIKERLQSCLDSYSEENGCGNLGFGKSWFNVYNENSSLLTHTHPDSILSGALYINVDQSSPGLYFFNPNQHVHFIESEKPSEYNYEYVKFKPLIGSLILFPSWLSHGSHGDVNFTKNRIVISFNTKKSGVRSMDRT